MKRDLELMREILLIIEESSSHKIFSIDLKIGEYSHEEIAYQIYLLMDAGYIDAFGKTSLGCCQATYTIYSLTSKGHDYLDNIRDPGIWKKTKDKLGSFVCSASLELIQSAALSVIQNKLGI